MRYNANEIYINPFGSISFWPRFEEDEGGFRVGISGRMTLMQGVEVNLFGGYVNLEATSEQDLFKTSLSVSGHDLYFEIRSNQKLTHYNDTLKMYNETIRSCVWAAVKFEGGIENFKKKMQDVYIEEFIKDMEGLQEFISKTRTDIFSALEDKNQDLLLQVALGYYDRVDPESEPEDE